VNYVETNIAFVFEYNILLIKLRKL